MIIEKVALCNWQGYHGLHEFNFKGSSGRSNSFIYADNTVGKSAFWEAISFVLFGRVKRRRGVNKYRPFVAKDSGDYPLMNTDEWGKPGANFHVELFFSHEGVSYRLFRGYGPKIEKKPVKLPNHMKQELEVENLDSRAGRERFEENPSRWIEERILPERLAKFFLFDGERLEEYEDLMRRDDDILLRQDIENIIRSPILRNGRENLRLAKSRFQSLHGEANVNATRDVNKRKEFTSLIKQIKDLEKSEKDINKEIQEYSEKIQEVEDWLAENDETKTAFIQIQELKKLKEEQQKAIEVSRKNIIRNMKGAWKTIISKQVKEALNSLDGDKEEQGRHLEKMTLLKEQIGHLSHELEGKPCSVCKRERDPLDGNKKKEIEEEITSLKIKYEQHSKNSKYPTVEEYVDRQRALMKLDTEETDLTYLFDEENSLMDGLGRLRKTNHDLSNAEDKISEEKSQQVKEKTDHRDGLMKKKGAAIDELGDLVRFLKEQRGKMKEFANLREVTDEDTTKMKRLSKSVDVATQLSMIFEDALGEHRENMRRMVERASTDIFLQISNNSENYNGLKITSEYTVSIDNKKGRRDAGSQAQSLVMAYSIIDALASCSGFEFPMIVDTPGRSLARRNINSVFDHFTSSDRQAIFLPNDRELDPADGDERYGKLCAATYELKKADEDRTEVVLRVDNLE